MAAALEVRDDGPGFPPSDPGSGICSAEAMASRFSGRVGVSFREAARSRDGRPGDKSVTIELPAEPAPRVRRDDATRGPAADTALQETGACASSAARPTRGEPDFAGERVSAVLDIQIRGDRFGCSNDSTAILRGFTTAFDPMPPNAFTVISMTTSQAIEPERIDRRVEKLTS